MVPLRSNDVKGANKLTFDKRLIVELSPPFICDANTTQFVIGRGDLMPVALGNTDEVLSVFFV